MNFFVDNKDDKIDQVYIHVHIKNIIIHINGNNKLYKHSEHNEAIQDLRKYFKEDKIKYIEEYLIENLKNIGVDVIIRKEPKENKDNHQFTLF